MGILGWGIHSPTFCVQPSACLGRGTAPRGMTLDGRGGHSCGREAEGPETRGLRGPGPLLAATTLPLSFSFLVTLVSPPVSGRLLAGTEGRERERLGHLRPPRGQDPF